MALPPQFLEELRTRLPLSDVVMKRVRLIRAGREFKAPCPFHNEKSPSFYVNDQKGFFHCLAGETGVILRHGIRPIRDLAGTTQMVLTRGGTWVEARFAAYGVQKLLRIRLTRNGLTKDLYATDKHRWFVRGVTRDVMTHELRPGSALVSVYADEAKPYHSQTDGTDWVVQSVEETDREEEVYCAEVPGEHAFALEDNILTGNCFGCGAHGDQIGFVMRHDNLSFMEAVEQLAAEAGLPVPKASPQERQRYERQKSLYDLVERAAKYYEQQLFTPAGQKALDYLRRRGLDEEAIARFRLGFAPQDGSGLHGALTQAGYAEADMIEAGLFKRPDAGRGARAFFWGRVMFPVTDRRGRVVAFGGRIMEGEGPKYINSADNPLFHKGHLLYGMSRARQAAADGHTLIVTEGYMDVISCVLAGFEGAVAPLGTALTETQILELWKLAPEGRRTPILCFDGDNAGRRAAQRAVERLLPLLVPDHSACVAFLPEKEDPDSLIRTGGKAALQAVLERAKPLAEVLWEMESVGRDLFQPDARAGLEAALFERCAQIKDQRVRRAYEQDMRDRLFKLARQHRAKGGGAPRAGGGQRRQAPGEVPVSRLFDRAMVTGRIQVDFSAQARTLLGGMLRNPRYFDQFGERLAAITLDNPGLEELRQEIVNQLTSEPDTDGEALVRSLCELGLEETVNDVLRHLELRGLAWFSGANPDVEKAARDLLDIARKVEDRDLRRELAEAEENLRRDFSEENLARLDQLRREYLAARGLSLDGEG